MGNPPRSSGRFHRCSRVYLMAMWGEKTGRKNRHRPSIRRLPIPVLRCFLAELYIYTYTYTYTYIYIRIYTWDFINNLINCGSTLNGNGSKNHRQLEKKIMFTIFAYFSFQVHPFFWCFAERSDRWFSEWRLSSYGDGPKTDLLESWNQHP